MPARKPNLALQRRADDPTLSLNENGTFQISVFNDLHFAEDDEKDLKTQDVMHKVLTTEKVQLVVLNGDLISGEATQACNSSAYLDQVVAPVVKHKLPWASTYGNHDSNPNLDPEQIYLREKKYTNSLTQRSVPGTAAGITNYYLPIFEHDASNTTTPAFILWFFDSRGGNYPTKKGDDGKIESRPDWVDNSVVEWFTKTRDSLISTYGKPIPSLAFVHIPVYAMRAFQVTGADPSSKPWINGERVQQQGYGSKDGYDAQDYPLIQALLNTSGLVATFSGHDHDNDWCFKWDNKLPDLNPTGNGINMCYGRHTGYGGYGDWARGGRQILLDRRLMEKDVLSWVRLENGSVTGSVHLNATYSQSQCQLPMRSHSAQAAIAHASIAPLSLGREESSGQDGIVPPSLGFVYLWIFIFSMFMPSLRL